MTTATAIPPPAVPFNDEEPSPDAMDRLWAALDATLDHASPEWSPPPLRGTVGTHECLRCGYRWTPRREPRPRTCPNPACRSYYWDRPPVAARARRPEATDWAKVRKREGEEAVRRRKQRHLAKVKALARELGLDITDPRTGKTLARTPAQAKVRQEELPTEPTLNHAVFVARGRTVPPPPGLDDLETPK